SGLHCAYSHSRSLYDCYFMKLHLLIHPYSFPTRRSSDLYICTRTLVKCYRNHCQCSIYQWQLHLHSDTGEVRSKIVASAAFTNRTKEHTSELQSRIDIVCRLLLEKKNETLCYLRFFKETR